jgi:acetyl coenzyme A synthetase (ADP forming)-like protein
MLEKLFKPSSIAVIGASSVPGKIGYMVLDHLVSQGYKGKIIPVNPKADEIFGLKCYKELSRYRREIDLSVITVPTEYVKNAVIASVEAGAGALVVITAGFKEVDKAGAELEKEIVEICRKNNVRMLGPNVLGIINTHHSMNASFDFHQIKKGNISVISQSGAICGAIIRWADLKQIGLAKVISIGNKADISEIDLLEALADDEDTRVIVGYLESIADGKDFIRAAEKVTQKKPVIIFKAGTSSAGMKAASSHTGSLAGADVAYGAAFRRSGVIRAETFEQLYDYATAFSMQPAPKGKSVAIITNAGGLGVICADAVENSGLKVAQLAHQTATALKKKLPNAASVGNPIDVLGDADQERYKIAVKTAMEADSVDAVAALLTVQDLTRGLEIAQVIAECTNGVKPLLACFMGGKDAIPALEELVTSNLPDYPSPERMVNALKAMYDYNLWTHRPPRDVTCFPVNKRRVDRVFNTYKRMGNFQVGEVDAKKVLRAYGFSVPNGALCLSAAQAVDVAEWAGYPVAMKIVSKDIIHKSDVGGVKINLRNKDDVRDAYDLMMLRIPNVVPEAQLEGVYVEQMAPKGREVILGMTRDPQFGPMMMFGLGGIFVEVMKDVSFNLAPITKEEAMQMLITTKSYELLKGIRGQDAVDIDAIATSLQYISQLVTDFPQIVEMDINPFMVGTVETPSVAADARITLLESWVNNE